MGNVYVLNAGSVTSVNGSVGDITISGGNLYESTWDYKSSAWINVSQGDLWLPDNMLSTETYLGAAVIEKRAAWNWPYQKIAVNAGESYTYSVYAKAAEPLSCSFSFNRDGEPDNATLEPSGAILVSVGTEWKRYSATYKAITSGYVYARLEGTKAGLLQQALPKLERGNVATDWSPAPKDIMDRLATLEAAAGITHDPPQVEGPEIMDEPADAGGVILLSCYASERRWAA